MSGGRRKGTSALPSQELAEPMEMQGFVLGLLLYSFLALISYCSPLVLNFYIVESGLGEFQNSFSNATFFFSNECFS